MPCVNSIKIGLCESCGVVGAKHYNHHENTVYCPECNKKYNVLCSKCNAVYDKRHVKLINDNNGEYICSKCAE